MKNITHITQMPDEEIEEYMIILPIIVLFGLTGNIISLVTIFHSRLRHVNANVYLVVLTLADSLFLLALCGTWRKVDYISFYFCATIEYLMMSTTYVSSWATAFLTMERYLAIAHPLRHVRYSHVDRVRVVLYWVWIPFVLHLWQFYSLVPNSEIGMRACRLKEADYQIIAQAVDTFLCYILPCSVIVILNALIVFKLKKSARSFGCQELSAQASLTSRRQGGNNLQAGTWTRILWVMPLVFLVLNTPFYVIMMIEVVSQVLYEKDADLMDRSPLFLMVYNLAHYLYYISPAIDVLVYAFSSANFRKTALIAWKKLLCSRFMSDIGTKAYITDAATASKFSFRPTSTALSRQESRSFRESPENRRQESRSFRESPENRRQESRSFRESPGSHRTPLTRSHSPLVKKESTSPLATTTV